VEVDDFSDEEVADIEEEEAKAFPHTGMNNQQPGATTSAANQGSFPWGSQSIKNDLGQKTGAQKKDLPMQEFTDDDEEEEEEDEVDEDIEAIMSPKTESRPGVEKTSTVSKETRQTVVEKSVVPETSTRVQQPPAVKTR